MIHIGSQSCGPHGHGLQRLNMNLLKPDRFSVSAVGQMVSLRNAQAHSGWVQYAPSLEILAAAAFSGYVHCGKLGRFLELASTSSCPVTLELL